MVASLDSQALVLLALRKQLPSENVRFEDSLKRKVSKPKTTLALQKMLSAPTEVSVTQKMDFASASKVTPENLALFKRYWSKIMHTQFAIAAIVHFITNSMAKYEYMIISRGQYNITYYFYSYFKYN